MLKHYYAAVGFPQCKLVVNTNRCRMIPTLKSTRMQCQDTTIKFMLYNICTSAILSAMEDTLGAASFFD